MSKLNSIPKKLSFAFFFLTTIGLYAGPFGLEKGMNLDKIAEVCDGKKPEYISDDIYQIYPKKNHELFEYYFVWVHEDLGLYYIKAVSSKIATSKYGTQLVDTFTSIKNSISNAYGEPEMVDSFKGGTLKSPDYWMFTLGEGDREYYCFWVNQSEKKKNDFLDGIILRAEADGNTAGYLYLEYRFDNYVKIQKLKDSVF